MTRLIPLFITAALVGACRDSAPPPAEPAPPVAVPTSPASPALPAPAIPPSPAASSPAQPAVATAIPPAFHGEWNVTLADCGGAANPSRLRIAAGALRFHESAGKVASVKVHSPTEITVEVALAGEGTSWRSTRRLRLSADGSLLQDVTDGAGLVRRRCPQAAPPVPP